jgi:quaternary ammonium compound-resistance protein SugE
MPWLLLFVAGIFEIMWATSLKASAGFEKPGPTIFTIVTLVCSFVFLAVALKELPVGTAYAVWTGIGAIGTVIAGIVFFNESCDPVRIGCLVLIILGIAGLRINTG